MALTQKTVDKAISTLDGMRAITKNEMLKKGVYLSPQVENQDLADEGAICGGHRACLVGSAYLSAGVRPKLDIWGDAHLPGIDDRTAFRARRPGLRLAMDALNEAAQARIDKLSPSTRRRVLDGYDPDYRNHDLAEFLFENSKVLTKRQEMLDLITHAKRIVRAKARESVTA